MKVRREEEVVKSRQFDLKAESGHLKWKGKRKWEIPCQRIYALTRLVVVGWIVAERAESSRTRLSSQAGGLRRRGAADGKRDLEGRPSQGGK